MNKILAAFAIFMFSLDYNAPSIPTAGAVVRHKEPATVENPVNPMLRIVPQHVGAWRFAPETAYGSNLFPEYILMDI
ncbi:MAG: hypothetical protein EPO08_21005 [Rhodospirillaceae bacterium]|nr:MAG: hypothetical protein EPO08_21005 [Rhodospirillaceae bacterium]